MKKSIYNENLLKISQETTSENSSVAFLGIDWGKSKIGLALADGETKLAFAFATLKNDKEFFAKLTQIIQTEHVGMVVLGTPSYVNRELVEHPAEILGKKLERELDVKVAYQNEMFTTKMAQDSLLERGIKGVGKFDDREAARIILQSWLDSSVTSNQ